MPLVACAQLRCGEDVAENLRRVEALAKRAAAYGCALLATPENTTFLGSPQRKLAIAEPLDGATHRRIGEIAAAHGIWILAGSVAERSDVPQKCFNTSVLFDASGQVRASYRKIHRFDIDLPDGTRFQESAHVAAGSAVVVAESPIGRIGMSVCYDLRFPELYRRLVEGGAEVLAVPSAFTLTTGRDHWHVLLRARAIENQCFVLAPAQEGAHGGGRHSYGHALICDPWGTVLAECGEGEGLAIAEIDPGRVANVRRSMPVSSHRLLA